MKVNWHTWYASEHERLAQDLTVWRGKLADLRAKAAQWHAEDQHEYTFAELFKARDTPVNINAFNTAAGVTLGRWDWLEWLGASMRMQVRPFSEWLELYEAFARARDYRAEREECDALSRGQG